MKKKILITLGTALTATIPVAAVVSCGKVQSWTVTSIYDKAPEWKGTVQADGKLGAIVSDPENPRWQKSKEMLQASGNAVFKDGALTAIQKSTTDQQNWITTNLEKIKALIVGATDNAVAGSFSSATQAKPVIAFDRLIETTERTAYNWYVTYDNNLVGKMQGIYIVNQIYGTTLAPTATDTEITDAVTAKKLTAKATILSIAGDPADHNATLFFNGAMDILKVAAAADTNFVIPAEFQVFTNVAQAKWDYNAGQTFMNTKLSAMDEAERKTVKAILSPNDGMATAMINALNTNGLNPKEVVITGQDGNDTAILSIKGDKNPGQNMTISKPDSLGTAVAVALAQFLLTDTATYNVGTASMDQTKQDAVLAAIKAAFPGIGFAYDNTSYRTSDNVNINTIILTPQVVDASNIDSIFTVKK